ncbi:GNAT family N-acetyltransferase [Undibacterium arcticum]
MNATLDTTFSLLDADRLVGFGQILTPAPGTVHLARIIVDPAARGHGLGATLCQLLMAHAVSTMAPSRFTLRVYSDNAAAVKTYTGLGFVTVDADPATAVLLMQKLVDR